MPRRPAAAPPANDPLREKLDQLAELAVARVLAKGDDATMREITETLKAVDAYHARTRPAAADPTAPSSAWGGYADKIVRKEPANGARH